MNEEYYITIDMLDYTCITKAIFIESIDKKSSVYYLPEFKIKVNLLDKWVSPNVILRWCLNEV